jgi:hypothetical protein
MIKPFSDNALSQKHIFPVGREGLKLAFIRYRVHG